MAPHRLWYGNNAFFERSMSLSAPEKPSPDLNVAHRIQGELQQALLSFDLEGAVLFGSRARRETGADSDVDLLAVARGRDAGVRAGNSSGCLPDCRWMSC